MKKLVIVGAGGHGKVVAEIAELNGYGEIIVLDDDETLKEMGKYKVVGTSKDIGKFSREEYDFFVAIGNPTIRKMLQEKCYDNGYRLATLIHPSAVVSSTAEIGEGSVVMPGVVINAEAKLGKGCIINTSSSVDHECVIKDYVHIAVGAHLAGRVIVEEQTWIGAGAIVINNITVPANSMIGAGAVVVKSPKEQGTYVGVPARKREELLVERWSGNANPICYDSRNYNEFL